MKLVVVGEDEHGRSCIVSTEPIAPAAPGEFTHVQLWRTAGLPPAVDVPRRKPGEPVMVLTDPAGSAFVHAFYPPRWASEMHRTDTLDYGVILAGAVVLVVDDGEIELEAGDCWVLPGVIHQWRTGDSGATISCTVLGLGTLESAGPINP
jgi:mannose-6-phosphate isomerase-like protein (cupin superfamily)